MWLVTATIMVAAPVFFFCSVGHTIRGRGANHFVLGLVQCLDGYSSLRVPLSSVTRTAS